MRKEVVEISKNLENKEISQRTFPIRTYVPEYIDFVMNVDNRDLKIVLKTILCSGFRFSEVLNSFMLYDNQKDVYYLTAYALKRKEVTNFVLKDRTAAKIEKLREDLIIHPERFKTVPLINLFDMNIKDVYSCANDMSTPKHLLRPLSSYFELKNYWQFYNSLKKNTDKISFRVYYLDSKLSGIEKQVNIIPSFHFFRKLFASELYYKLQKDPILTVEYMKWSQMNRLIDYVKMYQNPFKFTSVFEGL